MFENLTFSINFSSLSGTYRTREVFMSIGRLLEVLREIFELKVYFTVSSVGASENLFV